MLVVAAVRRRRGPVTFRTIACCASSESPPQPSTMSEHAAARRATTARERTRPILRTRATRSPAVRCMLERCDRGRLRIFECDPRYSELHDDDRRDRDEPADYGATHHGSTDDRAATTMPRPRTATPRRRPITAASPPIDTTPRTRVTFPAAAFESSVADGHRGRPSVVVPRGLPGRAGATPPAAHVVLGLRRAAARRAR